MKKLANIMLGCMLFAGVCAKGGAIFKIQPFENKETSCITLGQDVVSPVNSASKPADILAITSKAAYVTDEMGQTVVYEKNAEQRLPIASMCKIMTLILTFDAIKRGDFTFDDTISISERAASMGGSQVFLEANAKYPVKELIKSIVVCSANDSCVAMAEKISGSEEAFTQEMNEKAKALGANNTLFANCTGLPKEPQYSCAKDVAIMLRELIKNEEYYEFGKVWMDKFQHPEGRYTEISNTNKLVRFYDGCDGGKTGFTSQAGYCLAATAKRGDTRVISVVIGNETSKNRFDDARKLFDYTFANYTQKIVVDGNNLLDKTAYVNGGKEKCVNVRPSRSSFIFARRGETQNITTETVFCDRLKAPVKKGDKVGVIEVYKDGVMIDEVPLVANETVKKSNIFDRFRDVANGWTGR